ncbi:putative patatin/cPLA2 family phospholipase [Pasteurella langaaensis DSM 22999]|uniref:Putative patatin/cPLA2 family phospholipase n=1 Tax=Alitibacter langaaensis DSM 22999 TaxID=1122935 RepID=A0A2U0T5H9_9PAST|nr:patatin-like phospholipase family protein [Pasteurella langaaensis]PVX38853.1 putative patatin/cPLA2 family phospholipase [Pasteurella langaaensis DSM 22999]
MKIGLVLEGGAMRGMFTAGVLDVMLAENVQVDGMVTVSAGALFGVNFPSKQAGRVLRYNLKYLNDKRYMGLHSLLTTGNVVNRDFAFYELPFTLDPFDQATFAKSGIDFWVTLTNVETGEAEYVKITDAFAQMEALRATSAMPMVSKMVEIEGKKYLDGGIADSIPLQKTQALGFDKIIVVLTRPLDYRKTPSNNILFNLIYRKFPKLCKRWANRYAEYNAAVEQVIELERQGKIFVVRPNQDLHISRLEKDPHKVKAMYELGVAEGRKQIRALKAYLAQVE